MKSVYEIVDEFFEKLRPRIRIVEERIVDADIYELKIALAVELEREREEAQKRCLGLKMVCD